MESVPFPTVGDERKESLIHVFGAREVLAAQKVIRDSLRRLLQWLTEDFVIGRASSPVRGVRGASDLA